MYTRGKQQLDVNKLACDDMHVRGSALPGKLRSEEAVVAALPSGNEDLKSKRAPALRLVFEKEVSYNTFQKTLRINTDRSDGSIQLASKQKPHQLKSCADSYASLKMNAARQQLCMGAILV